MLASLLKFFFRRASANEKHVDLTGAKAGLQALENGDLDAAIRCFEEHLEKNPDDASAYNNLGVALQRRRQSAQALRAYETAVQLAPENAGYWYNAALIQHIRGDWTRAGEYYLNTLRIDPDNAEAHRDYSMLCLVQGDFSTSIWSSFRHRRQCHGFTPTLSQCPAPLWSGESLTQKQVLVHGEQGLGDEILFASCYTDLIAQAGHCVIETEPRLESLFRRSFPAASVFSRDQKNELAALYPSILYQLPGGDLPLYFRSSPDAFPAKAAYLSAGTDATEHWQRTLDTLGDGLKVGISWRGGTARTGRARRSIELEEWRPLFAVPDTHFISLQYDDCLEEISLARNAFGVNLHHWPAAISDYDETAALISALDLVISVQTSVVHLAGALGQKVWILASSAPRWCYMAKGENTPWYPSARIFRQSQPSEWDDVMKQVGNALMLEDRKRRERLAGQCG